MNPVPLLPDMFACACWILQSYGTSVFPIGEEEEVVFEFLNQPWAKLVLLPDGTLDMPAEGFNLVILAAMPGAGLYARIFREGKRLFDEPILPAPEVRELQDVLDPLWRRIRFFKAEKTAILQHIFNLTGIAFPGRFSSVQNELDPLRTEPERKAFVLRAVKFYTFAWIRGEVDRRGISLDAPLPDVDEEETRSLHDIVADPYSPIAPEVLAVGEGVAARQRALEDLASRERQGMEDCLAGNERESPLSPAERRRIHDGKEAFQIIRALHLLAETPEGRDSIASLARHLIVDERNRRLLVEHFCRDQSLSFLEPDDSPDSVRHRLLRAARVLWPFLAPSHLAVYPLMPDVLRQRTEALLACRDDEELAEVLDCSTVAELTIAVRLIHADVALLVDAVEKRNSPKGRAALARKISQKLSGVERTLATEIWISRRALRDAAAAAGVSEPEARKHLFRGLCRMNGRR